MDHRRPAAALLIASMVSAMTSCQSATAPQPAPPPNLRAEAEAAPVPAPQVRANPAPRDGYALSFAFDALPPSVTDVTATADYQVANPECVPLDYSKAAGGVRLAPRHSVALPLRPLADGRFAASAHRDALLDEDYYGLGECEWALASVTVRFRSPETHFVGGLPGDELRDGARAVLDYLVRDAAKKPASMDAVFGEAPGFYQASAGERFTLTVSAAKEAP